MGQYSFATNLKKERTNRGITQHELATGVHVAQNTVSDVKEIVDEAIRQSEKIGFRKLSMVLSKKRYDADDRVILYEKDFR